jgi:hypothetical protein
VLSDVAVERGAMGLRASWRAPPHGAEHRLVFELQLRRADGALGFVRVVVSEREAPNILVDLV